MYCCFCKSKCVISLAFFYEDYINEQSKLKCETEFSQNKEKLTFDYNCLLTALPPYNKKTKKRSTCSMQEEWWIPLIQDYDWIILKARKH